MHTLLVADDNADNRDALARRLRRRGYEVATAADGQAALAAVAAAPPALILMDLNMPGVDGWEAIHLLKADPASAHIPVLVLSSHATAGDRERAYAAGAEGYHIKPLDFDSLLAEIQALLPTADH